MIKDLKASHFNFSDISKPVFNPMMRSQYRSVEFPNMKFRDGYCGEVGVERGRATHFKVGNASMTFDT